MEFEKLKGIINENEPVAVFRNGEFEQARNSSNLKNNYNDFTVRYIESGIIYLEDLEDYVRGIFVYLD